MPRIVREAEIDWEGTTARGSGVVRAASTGSFELQTTIAARIDVTAGKTSPEELLAAAHAGCLTMSLASELTQAGTPPGRLDVTCTIVMDEVEAQGHQIVGSNVVVSATVDGVSDEALNEAITRADEGCPFSQLLKRAGAQVSVRRG
jgi:osmotically inducible protein OsmC